MPKWELVTEKLFHQEVKLKEKASSHFESDCKALIANQKRGFKKQFTCHYCHKPGHFKKDCRKYLASQKKQGASMAEKRNHPAGNNSEAHVTIHALTATLWKLGHRLWSHLSHVQ